MDITPLLRAYANIRLAALARLDPAEVQARTLLALVRRARHTRFGRDHGFERIRSVAEYQAMVPLRRHAEFWRDYWQAPFPRLEDVTWPGTIPLLAQTSGTASGSSKSVPVSAAMLAANRRAALDVLVHHLARRPRSRVLAGPTFMLGGSTALETLAPGIRRGDLSAIAACTVPAWARPWSFPPPELALDTDWERKIARLAKAVPAGRVRAVAGTPGWLLAFLERLGGSFAAMFPRLEMVVHGGVGFAPYRARFGALMAGGGAETAEVYPASEGFVALADGGDGEGLRMQIDNGLFFELVPAAEVGSPAPTRHWLATAQPGIDYALVLTTCAGLWSYVLGDTVRLTGLKPPRLLVSGRLGIMLNAVGEHLSGQQLDDAVAAAGGQVSDYAVGVRFAETGVPRHVFVVEFPGPIPVDFSTRLDAALAAGSLDYRERRAGSVALAAPELVPVPPGFFAAWMKRRGRLGGQNKVPRIADGAMLEELLATAPTPPPPPAGAGSPPR
ncbi:GH3 auxin-responsive promoter family protein [Magnetospirillum sp. UT-4]|uniref:GH3 family domain-containing protein n=1 Tax=Magnetospirillum sp. UT-4 TaxID=2681467 RepID=UPI00137D55DF|nr:GH3 auxin-responsive promoter family protein [Magnetospirillum sp. UT-4]CAA7626471.1 putative auxin-regulated protein [Magnetospirillum sp. UT-4]